MPASKLEHHYADINGLKLHYVSAGSGEPLMLIHGFPQTWHEWHKVIPALAKRFRVIAPDYRGAGDSARPTHGFDKQTMMEDVRGLAHSLGIKKLRLVGHDVGTQISWRWAALHPNEIEKLVLMDSPIPGTDAWTQVRNSPRAWHIDFHNARDISDFLVSGKEREYFTFFFASRMSRPDSMSQADMDVYIKSYASPGGVRCGFEVYRAMLQDAEDNKPYLRKKLEMPVLMIAGGASVSGPLLEKMMPEIASDYKFIAIAESGHWLCEEAPEKVEKALLKFL